MTEPRRPPLLPILGVGLVCLVLFAFVAWHIRGDTALTRFDLQAAEWFHEVRQAHPGWTPGFRFITDLGSVPTLTAVAVAVGLILCRARQLGLLAVWLVALAGGDRVCRVVKEAFQRPRPFAGAGVNWSFPSSHSMDSLIGYGLLAYLAFRFLPDRAGRVAAMAIVVVGLVGFSRVYLGAHYPGDVAGGFALGGAWVCAWVLAVECVGPHRPGTPPGGP